MSNIHKLIFCIGWQNVPEKSMYYTKRYGHCMKILSWYQKIRISLIKSLLNYLNNYAVNFFRDPKGRYSSCKIMEDFTSRNVEIAFFIGP